MRKILSFIICAVLVFSGLSLYAASSKQRLFNIITENFKKKHFSDCRIAGHRFLSRYPKSHLVPDVRLFIAESESDPKKAVTAYRFLVRNYRKYRKRAYAAYQLCTLLFLTSRWKELAADSAAARIISPDSGFRPQFLFFGIIAELKRGEISRAEDICSVCIKENHEYEILARGLLLCTESSKKSTGFSRSYLKRLNEIITGFQNADVYPAALYLLGNFYERKKYFNRSFSAYLDIARLYPESPEAEKAKKRLQIIRKYNPSRVSYLPDKKTINNTDTIDLSPEIKITDRQGSQFLYYAISIGPLSSIKRLKTIRDITSSMGSTKRVQTHKGYYLYCGRAPDADAALRLKIRLAEEYGINGRIVRISGNNKRKYIYGD